ncbi:MAG: HdeD family acid-resistance protein [Candidatus Rifleibacteriota bacterium]
METKVEVKSASSVSYNLPEMKAAAEHWPWFIVFGLCTIFVGFIAFLLPRIATITAEILFASILIAVGIVQFIQGFKMLRTPGITWYFVGAAVSLLLGIALLVWPITGILSLSLAVGIYFLVAGIFRVMYSLQIKKVFGFNWLLLSGILGIVLGVLVIGLWPAIASILLGTLIAIDLIFSGCGILTLGIVSRKWKNEVIDQAGEESATTENASD